MAIPGSGKVSIGDIRTELQNGGTNNFSLKKAGRPTTNGLLGTDPPQYTPVNQNSPVIPNNSQPYNLSEWRGYDHSQHGICSATSFTSPSVEGIYIYYKVRLTGTTPRFTSNISVQGSGMSNNYYANFYTSYPFTNTGEITGTPVLQFILSNDVQQVQTFTVSSFSDVYFHVVLYRMLI
jgi:hypothetical protein